MYDLQQLRCNAPSRRAFLARMSAAGLGAAAITLLDGCGGSDNSGPSDNVAATRAAFTFTSGGQVVTVPGASSNTIVLNYALTLETLEADLYRQALNAASGRPLTQALDTTPPANNTTGAYARMVGAGSVSANFVQAAFLYLVQFAYIEAAHRDYLRTILGASASPLTPPNKFQFPGGTPGADLGAILSSILPLEETGVRAYLGASKYITDNTTLQAAAAIYSTEARHSASIEYILGQDPGPRNNITGVPTGEYDVATGNAANIFEKALNPTDVLVGASTAYFA